MDLRSREQWVEFSGAKDEMFSWTDIKRLPGPIQLPPRPFQSDYRRPPKDQHSIVDARFWERAPAAVDGTASGG